MPRLSFETPREIEPLKVTLDYCKEILSRFKGKKGKENRERIHRH